MQIEDIVGTLQFQLILIVARVDGVNRLDGEFAVEAEVVSGGVRREVVVDTQRFLVEGEVELGVTEGWKSFHWFFIGRCCAAAYNYEHSNISSLLHVCFPCGIWKRNVNMSMSLST